jgi:dienelactone hydrolase
MFLQSRFAPQVHWGDIAMALDGFPCDDIDLSSPGFWEEWRARWTVQGDRYTDLASQSSTAAGRARAERGAAACYHWAEFMYFDDPKQKLELRQRVRECFGRSLRGTGLEVINGELPPLDDRSPATPYWLVLPDPAVRPPGAPPCIVLSNGLDSMTEVEILSLAEPFLERGIAALLFDGPGQGIHLGQFPLRIEMEAVVAALLDHVRARSLVAAERIAFLGVSFGGYFALRVAQALGSSLRCVVNYSGGPSVTPFEDLPRRLKDDFRFALTGGGAAGGDAGGSDALDMQARLDALALTPGTAPATDVLSVHGALDDIFPLAALADLDQAWAGRHSLIVEEREAHVCLNLLNACSVRAADWVAERLLVAPMPA